MKRPPFPPSPVKVLMEGLAAEALSCRPGRQASIVSGMRLFRISEIDFGSGA